MKALSLKDLPRSTAIKLFELGYAAGSCKEPAQFQKVLKGLLEVFPADAVLGGFGRLGDGTEITEIWRSPKLPDITIAQVGSLNWPIDFMKTYLEENLIARDAQFYECLRTQRPQLWIDLYEKSRYAFDPRTKRGFYHQYVELAHDYNVTLTLRQLHIDSNQTVGNFSLIFRSRSEAHRHREILQAFIPYLHHALLRSYGKESTKIPGGTLIPLSHREREVLRWLMEGKGNWEIGKILHISERTVKFHIQNLMKKFEATNRSHLVANAFIKQTNGLLH